MTEGKSVGIYNSTSFHYDPKHQMHFQPKEVDKTLSRALIKCMVCAVSLSSEP